MNNTNRAIRLSINDVFISEALSLAAIWIALYGVAYHDALIEAKRLIGKGLP